MSSPRIPDSPLSVSGDVRDEVDRKAGGILANVGYSLISQVSSGVFTAILTLYLIRALSPTQYGDFGTY